MSMRDTPHATTRRGVDLSQGQDHQACSLFWGVSTMLQQAMGFHLMSKPQGGCFFWGVYAHVHNVSKASLVPRSLDKEV